MRPPNAPKINRSGVAAYTPWVSRRPLLTTAHSNDRHQCEVRVINVALAPSATFSILPITGTERLRALLTLSERAAVKQG